MSRTRPLPIESKGEEIVKTPSKLKRRRSNKANRKPVTQWADLFEALRGDWEVAGQSMVCISRGYAKGLSKNRTIVELSFYGGDSVLVNMEYGDAFENCAKACDAKADRMTRVAKLLREQGVKFRNWMDETGGKTDPPTGMFD